MYRSRFNDPDNDFDNVSAMFGDICGAVSAFMCSPAPDNSMKNTVHGR